GQDGKLRLTGPYAQDLKGRMAGILEQLEAAKKYEKSYLKLAALVNDAAARTALTSETSMLFLIRRAIRQAADGAPAAIGELTEADEDNKIEAAIKFHQDLAALVPDAKDGDRILGDLKAPLSRLAGEIDGTGAE